VLVLDDLSTWPSLVCMFGFAKPAHQLRELHQARNLSL